MTNAVRLFGTEAVEAPRERLTFGNASFTLENGAIRHLCVGDREIIRNIAFLVRDRDWGTTAPLLTEVSREITRSSLDFQFKAVFSHGPAQIEADLCISAKEEQLQFTAAARATHDFETNRTGFTVLHPAAVAGCPASITHSDGRRETAQFPTLIDPWQPFMDIVTLEHRADGLAVQCAFEGDTFEMEDQRQWGDASFKTYNRPLAKPWPYLIRDGERLTQSVCVSWRPVTAAKPKDVAQPVPAAPATFPDSSILVTAAQALVVADRPEDVLEIAPQRLLCHVDDTLTPAATQFEAFARLQDQLPQFQYDLELVSGFSDAPSATLASLRHTMDATGFNPANVLVCPSVDRQSTPPGSDWPDCPPLDDIHRASAEHFADLTRGGGMVTFFPELNRKRPPVEMLDFVTHSLCPIVHAADDLSVMETLEAVPHITRSARAIIGAKDYRIGPSTIAMRHNPYGKRTIPNPTRDRVCMADDDPRHGAMFGAAYTIGLATALAPAGIRVWTPVEATGPRGAQGPLKDATALLSNLAGRPVERAEIQNGLAVLQVGGSHITANLRAETNQGLAPYEWTVTA